MNNDSSKSTNWKLDSQRFNDVANLYDIYRPSYPVELIEDIILFSGIQPEGRILEIGSGTGKATILFAPKRYSILCLEPGQNLMDIAVKNLVSYPHVSFVKTRFEDWACHQEKFDLVISAQAYHWIPEEVRYEKTGSVLRYLGHLAVFWNMDPGMDGKIKQELDRAYRNRAPELVKPKTPIDQLIESRANSLREAPYFKNIIVRKYPWSVRYKTSEYLGLLNTYSDHLRLSQQRQSKLYKDIEDVIEQNGGYIEKPYLAVVYIAQRNYFR